MAVFYVVRHAKAGSRSHWERDDRLRPLSKKGVKQAEALVSVLQAFPISAILSSPYLRCMQTVEPLARARELTVQETSALAEGRGLKGVLGLMATGDLDHAVLCTHGDIVWELVEDLVKRRILAATESGIEKGSTWIVDVEEGTVVRARFLPAA